MRKCDYCKQVKKPFVVLKDYYFCSKECANAYIKERERQEYQQTYPSPKGSPAPPSTWLYKPSL